MNATTQHYKLNQLLRFFKNIICIQYDLILLIIKELIILGFNVLLICLKMKRFRSIK